MVFAGELRAGARRVGSGVAFVLAALFMENLARLVFGFKSPFPDNWLVVLYKVNAHVYRVPAATLRQVTITDLVIMVLFCILMLIFFLGSGSRAKVWAAVAAIISAASIPLFLVTRTAGRSGVLLCGAVASGVMCMKRMRPSPTGWIGMGASILLLVGGDFATAAFPPSDVTAVVLLVGYLAWIVWLVLSGTGLLITRGDTDATGNTGSGRV